MKEIGGYIEFEHYHGNEFHAKAIKLNCSRNALAYLLRLHKIQKIYIPCFLCDSVLDVCKKEFVKVEFYHVDENFLPEIPNADFSKNWLYVVNYYGQLRNEKILDIAKSCKNLIVDNVQSFFQQPVCHVPTIYNCRKFFGVADGAYLYSEERLQEDFPKDLSYDRMQFLLGRFEKTASEFYSGYSANNHFFAGESIKSMSALTENVMRSIDYGFVEKRRTENFEILHASLSKSNRLSVEVPKGAFMYPFLIENGEDVRKKLLSKKIYIPTLWPDAIKNSNSTEREIYFAKNILPIPCDQRYGMEEMNYILKSLNEVME